jgi:ketosteroid isomerase-like protein
MSHHPRLDKRKDVEDTWDAINARDFETLAELLHSQGEFRSVIAASEGEVYYGIDGLRKWAGNVDATWANFHTELVEFHDAGEDKAVVISRVTGQARQSGVPLDVSMGQVITWRDGKPWLNEAFTDPRKALEASGLQE